MRQLSGHDAAYFYSDNAHANSNVTLVHIYDQSTAPGGVVRFKQILAQVENRLDRLSLFRQKIIQVPMNLDYPTGSKTTTSSSTTTFVTSPCPSRVTGASSASRARASMRVRWT